ncbi:von Willebrand factor type A domain protein [anaerobic digester metagenome]
MKKILYLTILVFISCLIPHQGSAAETVVSDRVAVALVLDNSGSMKNSDPLNNRFTAAKMVVDLLTESDYLSVSTFSDDAVNLVPMTELKGNQDHLVEAAFNFIPAPTGYTDYQKALKLAEENLDQITDPSVRRFILFLTDGKPELRDKKADMNLYFNQLTTKVQEIGNKNYPIYTVGFGESDQQILKQISADSRGATLVGNSSSLAPSFFEILRNFKNRFVLVDEEVNGEKEYSFVVDEYTSRVAILVQDNTKAGQFSIIGEDNKIVEPDLRTDDIQLFNLNENLQNKSKTYRLTGNWKGKVQAVRDTKTKLWITEPLSNAQVPYEQQLTAKITQTGAVGETGQLEAKIIQNGKALNLPIEIKKNGLEYELLIGKFPQTGIYDLQVSLVSQNQLVAKSTVTFEIKNIPVLRSSLTEQPPVWIKGEYVKVTASLLRNGNLVRNNLDEVEIAIQLNQENSQQILLLKDDGSSSSGDIIKGDKIYSGWVSASLTGPLTYSLSARGVYLGETFFTGGEPVQANVLQPGSLKVSFPNGAIVQDGTVSAEIEIINQSDYPETVTALILDQEATPAVTVEPGATVRQVMKWAAKTSDPKADIKLVTAHEVTKLERFLTLDIKTAQTPKDNTLLYIMIGASVLALVGLLIFWKKRPKKVRPDLLKGTLVYETDGTENSIHLSGNQMDISIGKDSLCEIHIPARGTSFKFTVYPIRTDADSAVIEVRCAPPGMMKAEGKLATTGIFSPGDSFEIEGYQIHFEIVDGKSTGQNVLEGRL